MRFRCLLLMAGLLLLPRGVAAAPVLAFEWVHDIEFGTGSIFNVTNYAGSSLVDVSIDLFSPGSTSPFQTLVLGDIEAGAVAQTIDDLSWVLVPDDLERAALRALLNSHDLFTTLHAATLTGDPASLLATSIELTLSDTEPPVPVPEPSAVLLLGVGLAAWRMRRWTSPPSLADEQ